MIFILGVTVQQSQVCSRSYQSSAMVSKVLCVCLCGGVVVYLHVYATGSRVKKTTERERETLNCRYIAGSTAASLREVMAHGVNLQRDG